MTSDLHKLSLLTLIPHFNRNLSSPHLKINFYFIGVNCETQCPPGLYGENCDKECLCLNNSSCDPKTGKCICNRGWTGDTCGDPCPDGYYGHGCKEKCPNVVYGNKSCNHVTGEYVCRPGYIGLTCEHPCPTGTYGPHCSLKCMCEHGAECSHITGQCQCAPGWTGSSCKFMEYFVSMRKMN